MHDKDKLTILGTALKQIQDEGDMHANSIATQALQSIQDYPIKGNEIFQKGGGLFISDRFLVICPTWATTWSECMYSNKGRNAGCLVPCGNFGLYSFRQVLSNDALTENIRRMIPEN